SSAGWISSDGSGPSPTRPATKSAARREGTWSGGTRRPESAVAAPGFRQLVHALEAGSLHRSNHELGDSVAALDRDGLHPNVGNDHPNLPPVVAVDRAGSVGKDQPVLQSQAAAHP